MLDNAINRNVGQGLSRPTSVLEQYEQARIDYFAACARFNEAQGNKGECYERVQKLAEAAAQYIQEGTADPTIPKEALTPQRPY